MSSLFLQSEIENPYSFYQEMLKKHPVYWDEANKIWAVYSYEYCTAILKNTEARIPALAANSKLNQYAAEIIGNLARLSNGAAHEIAREATAIIFSYMKSGSINTIIKELLLNDDAENSIDWVDVVCKKLPVLAVLKSFDFDERDSNFILEKIAVLVKIMSPNKTDEDVELINEVSAEIYSITKKHLSQLSFYENLIYKITNAYVISSAEAISICVSNLIGLFIQSYDAGRGLLSNSLLQIFSKKNMAKDEIDRIWIEKMVIETLRFDPPIHNTRRIASEDIQLGGLTIKKNDLILVVLAGANRDSNPFKNAMTFDIDRKNNHDHLTFGAGGHNCLAKYFSINITTEALFYLLDTYKNSSILAAKIEYEPLVNARLPKAIYISLFTNNI